LKPPDRVSHMSPRYLFGENLDLEFLIGDDAPKVPAIAVM